MELWDIYNANREKTGKTMVRGASFEKGDYHLVVHVCIFGTDGRMLIQQRQKDKDGWPDLWDLSVGGSSVAGEDAQTAASREMYEELGIRIDLTGIRPHLSVNFDFGFDDIFLIEKDIDLRKIILQTEEVQNVQWATRSEIKQMISDGSFVPYYPSLIDFIFDSHNHYGMYRK